MQERLLAAEARGGDAVAGLGEAVLYFGCRRRDQDYLYGGLLERWAAEGKLTLFTAFSRQQVHKPSRLSGLYISSSLAAPARPSLAAGRRFE